jgi:hypothetical protein
MVVLSYCSSGAADLQDPFVDLALRRLQLSTLPTAPVGRGRHLSILFYFLYRIYCAKVDLFYTMEMRGGYVRVNRVRRLW